MKATELRIGNLVLNTVNGLDWNIEQSHLSDECCDYYRGISLTKDWLLNLGFTEHTYGGFLISGKMFVDFNERTLEFEYRNTYHPIIISHVHQLQNLYFCLTGEELTIKQ